MAKILTKVPKKEDMWKIVLSCAHRKALAQCNTLVEIDCTDIRKKISPSVFRNLTYYGFVCPNCGNFTTVDGELIPKSFRDTAKKYIPPK